MNQDMIKLPDFKSQKRANLQGLEKFLGQKNARMPLSTRAKNGDELIRPLFSRPIQRRLSPNIWRNRKGSLNHDPLIEMFDSVTMSDRMT
jgi:hypothetical protein|tara:strand:+ start:316 stop:585 length:270 start_codon:yes stop_codon:yes gene_type:complete